MEVSSCGVVWLACLPDLDVLLDHGDPILNMIRHRAESHALLLLTLFSVPHGLGGEPAPLSAHSMYAPMVVGA